MAKETVSESLVRVANRKYCDVIQIQKNDPHMRLVGRTLLHAGSRGLDYSGLFTESGRHLEFEVKETEEKNLPVNSIRQSQLECLERLSYTEAVSFLLVYFKALDQWYRIQYPQLIVAINLGYKSLPVDYFRAYGQVVPNGQKWPRYLHPECHPEAERLRASFPSWMPPLKPRREPVQMEVPDPLDMESRRKRIFAATMRGIKNAERKEIAVSRIKQQKRSERALLREEENAGYQTRDTRETGSNLILRKPSEVGDEER